MLNYIYIIFLILVLLAIIVTIFAMIIYLWTAIFRVPWVRTSRKLTTEMFKLANLQAGEKVVDFGSGDGTMVINAVRDFGASGTGIDSQWFLNQIAKLRARLAGVNKKVDFVTGNFFKMVPPEADVITTYLFNETNAALEPILLKHYPSGTRVVTRVFVFSNLEFVKKRKIGKTTLYLYRIP